MKPYKKLWWPRFRPFFWVVDELKPTKRGPRGASNYGLFIIVRKTSTEWQIQQEIYESRYWVTHFWRLVDFFWFYVMKPRQWRDGEYAMSDVLDWRYARWKKAAAHLSRVECASRAQEIRARMNPGGVLLGSRSQAVAMAHDYARSIHGASNYAYIHAAGWTVDDCYNEIINHL